MMCCDHDAARCRPANQGDDPVFLVTLDSGPDLTSGDCIGLGYRLPGFHAIEGGLDRNVKATLCGIRTKTFGRGVPHGVGGCGESDLSSRKGSAGPRERESENHLRALHRPEILVQDLHFQILAAPVFHVIEGVISLGHIDLHGENLVRSAGN
jgi:hypothetical protein